MKMINLKLSRLNKMCLLMLLDTLLLPFALWCAVYLRLGAVWPAALQPFLWIFAMPALWVLPIFVHLGLYRAVLRFLNDKVLVTVFYGVSSAMKPSFTPCSFSNFSLYLARRSITGFILTSLKVVRMALVCCDISKRSATR